MGLFTDVGAKKEKRKRKRSNKFVTLASSLAWYEWALK